MNIRHWRIFNVMLTIYSKSAQENIPAYVLRKIAEEKGHATP